VGRWLRQVGPSVLSPVALALASVAWVEHGRTGFWLSAAVAATEGTAALGWLALPRWRVVWANLITLGALFVFAEGYLLWANRPNEPALSPPLSAWKRRHETSSSDVYFYPTLPWHEDPILGSVQKPGSVLRERRYFAKQLIAAQTYTTGAHGFRVTKPAKADANAVLLFGCSMTWGSNIADTESYPWQLGELLGPSVKVLNFGIPGAGPGSMLALIEAGYEREELPRGHVVGGYYLAWLERPIGHLARVLGRVPWSGGSPRYRLGGAAPPYAVADGRWPVTFDQWLNRHSLVSAQLGRALGSVRASSSYSESDVDLLTGIVLESDRLLQERDRVRLTVILLHDYSSGDLEAQFAQRLAAHGLRVLPVWLPHDAYVRHDIHPNAWGAQLLAQTVYADMRAQERSSALP
jgi:hypothetical protein